jgi:hypothetical protein
MSRFRLGADDQKQLNLKWQIIDQALGALEAQGSYTTLATSGDLTVNTTTAALATGLSKTVTPPFSGSMAVTVSLDVSTTTFGANNSCILVVELFVNTTALGQQMLYQATSAPNRVPCASVWVVPVTKNTAYTFEVKARTTAAAGTNVYVLNQTHSVMALQLGAAL